VIVHLRRHVANEPNTYDDLIQLWQSLDDEVSRLELRERRRRTPPRIVVAGWCFYAVFLVTTLICLPLALHAVGQALA
jgi:hypothetical protein